MVVNDLIKVLENKTFASSELVRKILNNKDARHLFISEYKYFNDDDNLNLYELFIEEKIILKNIYLLSETIELAININNIKSYNFIKDKLLTKNHYLVKISCLDYINHFYNKRCIQQDEYLNLNNQIKKCSSNKIVKFQVYINLLIFKKEVYFRVILKFLNNNKEPFYLYRIVTSFLNYESFSFVFKEKKILNEIINLINSNKIINSKDKFNLIELICTARA
ncbi:hypothetical protein [Aquimarina algiphila]|uniref:hypothetical protein n=1 Tax=Aquimarina algiphila TaxID=2047982 RepID=UPI00232FECB7|nr:hypothetical protein [Aquimarina algiphila]